MEACLGVEDFRVSGLHFSPWNVGQLTVLFFKASREVLKMVQAIHEKILGCVCRMQFYMLTNHLLGVMGTCKIAAACKRGEDHHASECKLDS